MKPRILLFFAALVLMSCTVDYVEPRYDSRDKIVGDYDVEEYSETYNDYTYYSLYISKSRHSREIFLDNFYAADIRVYALLDGDRITIPFQVVEGYEVDGTGTLYGNEIDLSYRVRDRYNNTRTDYCQMTARFEY